MANRFRLKKTYIIRIPEGEDLLRYIEGFCVKNRIKNALVSGIGGAKKTCFGYYDISREKYIPKKFNKFMEIVNLTGNISLKDKRPFPHLHISCADSNGKVYGGHLMPGTEVFIAEIGIMVYEGEKPLERTLDKKIGLALWQIK